MEVILSFLKTDTFLYIMIGAIFLLFILYISSLEKLSKLRKSYSMFMKKLGNGNNLDEMLREYIDRVEKVSKTNDELYAYNKKQDNDISRCTQKVGMVRYNAFKDTGSNLSFTLALLNEYNDGFVLNGIYARDMSNIFAKPIKNGKSEYALSDEEKEAIEKAIRGE